MAWERAGCGEVDVGSGREAGRAAVLTACTATYAPAAGLRHASPPIPGSSRLMTKRGSGASLAAAAAASPSSCRRCSYSSVAAANGQRAKGRSPSDDMILYVPEPADTKARLETSRPSPTRTHKKTKFEQAPTWERLFQKVFQSDGHRQLAPHMQHSPAHGALAAVVHGAGEAGLAEGVAARGGDCRAGRGVGQGTVGPDEGHEQPATISSRTYLAHREASCTGCTRRHLLPAVAYRVAGQVGRAGG